MTPGNRKALAFASPVVLFVLIVILFQFRNDGDPLSSETPKETDGTLMPEDGKGQEDSSSTDSSDNGNPDSKKGDGVDEVTGGKGVVLPLRMTDRVGRPLKGRLRLLVSTDYFRTFEIMDLETDEEGGVTADLDPGAWVAIDASASGHAGRWMAPVTWGEIGENGLSFSLGEGRSLKGRLAAVDETPGAGIRIRFSPLFPPGHWSSQLAAKLDIEDETVTADETGSFSCSSLRKGDYELSFPDHPGWPKIRLKGEQLESGELDLPVTWRFK